MHLSVFGMIMKQPTILGKMEREITHQEQKEIGQLEKQVENKLILSGCRCENKVRIQRDFIVKLLMEIC